MENQHTDQQDMPMGFPGVSNQQQMQHDQQQQQQQMHPPPPVQVQHRTTAKVLRCETCGIVTHDIERTLFGKKKIPRTEEGLVVRGVCLQCNEADGRRSSQAAMLQPARHTSGVPQELVVKSGDDATVVSQITLDHRFDAPDESDEESGHFRVTPGQRRPEPSLGDPDEYERPAPLRRSRQGSRGSTGIRQHQHSATGEHFHNQSAAGGGAAGGMTSEDVFREREQEIRNNFPPSPPGTNLQNNNNAPWVAPTSTIVSDDLPQPTIQQQTSSSQAYPPYMNSAQIPQIFENQVMQHHTPYTSSSPAMVDNNKNNSQNNNNRRAVYASAERPPSISSSYGQEEKAEIEAHEWPVSPVAAGLVAAISSNNTNAVSSNNTPDHGAAAQAHAQASVSHLRSLSDIPELVDRLNTSSNIGSLAVAVLQCMASIVWKYGQPAKLAIASGTQGLEGLTMSMWDSMADAAVQEAALNLIFALVSSSDGLASSDVFIGQGAESVVDALLIVMQTHLTVENIQHAGCGTLACLAAASGNNPAVDDASLSGALETVVSAMEAHRNSQVVQCTGIRALYNQCLYSRHAESNKRCLAKTGMEEKKCGAAVIYRAIEISEGDMVTMEWACRLYWCLSASEDVAEFLTVTNHPIYLILEALQRYHHVKDAAGLLEAIFGALANLVKVRDNHKVVDSSILFLVVKAARTHEENEDILVEACALIANLVSISSDNADVAVEADAIEVIFNALQAFPESGALFEEALRSLASLCLVSEEAKRYMSTPAMLLCLSRASSLNDDSVFGQEMFVNLMGSIMTRQGFHKNVIAHGGVNAMLTAMKAHPNDRKVQEAGCLAIRNLACHCNEDSTNINLLEPIHLMSQAMARHPSSESIQISSCCTLWNIAAMDNNLEISQLSEKEVIQSIVKAMQTHMESASVLAMACGALCGKISGNLEAKKSLVESGGLDAVTCVLVMHPNESGTLEKAFGVLSSLSASTEFADEVANAQCMANVVEAMRANSSSITLLEFGCLVLRNIILLRPEHVSESDSVVATILNGMRDNPDAVGFQREACSLLWAMAAVSESCKSKVLSLDGIAVLLGCLEHNSSFADVQDAALGAFNQLTPGMNS